MRISPDIQFFQGPRTKNNESQKFVTSLFLSTSTMRYSSEKKKNEKIYPEEKLRTMQVYCHDQTRGRDIGMGEETLSNTKKVVAH